MTKDHPICCSYHRLLLIQATTIDGLLNATTLISQTTMHINHSMSMVVPYKLTNTTNTGNKVTDYCKCHHSASRKSTWKYFGLHCFVSLPSNLAAFILTIFHSLGPCDFANQ
ncbi:hypothetical protein SLA2020_404940 [Shorea laevis]